MPVALTLLFLYFIAFHVSIAAMEILLWLLVVVGAISAFRGRTFLWPQKLGLWALIGLLISVIISYFINLREAPISFITYIGQFRWIISYIFLIQFFNAYHNRINYQKLVSVAQVVVVIAGVYCFYQMFTAHDPTRPNVMFHQMYEGSRLYRPNSFFGLPTTFAYVSSMFFSVSLAFFLYRPQPLARWEKTVERLYLVISPLSIFIAFTRAVWMAFTASTLILLRVCNKKYFWRFLFSLVVVVGITYSSFGTFQKRLDSIFDSQYVANHNRIYLWKANLMMFQDHPIFGYGFGSDKKNHFKMVDSYLTKLGQGFVMRNHPHNTYINFLSGTGIVGATFFFLFLFAGVRTTWRGYVESKNKLHKTLFIGVLGVHIVILLGGLTECAFEDGELRHQYMFYLALQEYLFLAYIRPLRGKHL